MSRLGLNSGVFASVLRLASGAFIRLFHGNYRTTLMRTGTGPFGDLKTWRAGAMAGRVDAQFCHRKRFNLVIKMVSELASLRSRNCNDGINWCGCGLEQFRNCVLSTSASIHKIRESALYSSGRRSHLAADRSWTCWQNRRSRNYTRKRSKIFQGHSRVAQMTGKRRSRPAVPASSTASKAPTASGVRPRAPKLPKVKRRVQKNRGLEEALLKIAEIWQHVGARRRRRRHRTQTN